MNQEVTESLIATFRSYLSQHGNGPEATGMSLEGQRFRFAKLSEIADLKDRRVLDLGCGLGDFYPFLVERFGRVDYTGIDLVPESIALSAQKYPQARFLCRNLFSDGLDETFDYVLLSAVFNNAMPRSDEFMKELLTLAFQRCSRALGFNFISTHVNFVDAGMAYHDPTQVLDFCIKTLTRKVTLFHQYERCDVAVFAYR